MTTPEARRLALPRRLPFLAEMMNPQPQPQWPPQPPPRAKGGHGCLIAIAVIAGVMTLGAIAIGIVAWRFSQSETGQKALAPTKMVMQAQNAPGTKELRDLGCSTATVLDLKSFEEAIARAGNFDAGNAALTAQGRQVGCRLALVGKKPSCDEVAASYVAAIGGSAEGGFTVDVTPAVGVAPVCHASYDESGAPVGTR